VGLQLLKSSVDKIIHPEDMNFNLVTIVVLVIAILIKLWQAGFYINVGKKITSTTIMATAADSRNDVIATSAVLLSVIFGRLTGYNIDGYMGCLVAIFILWSGIQLVRDTSSPLLGEAPDEDLVKNIARIVIGTPSVLGIHDLIVHNYGPGKVFASIHIEVDADGDLMESHDMIDNIERTVSESLHIHFVAHMDPIKTHDPLIAKLKDIVADTLEPLDGIVSFHDFRIVPGPTHTNVIFDVVMRHDCPLSEKDVISTVSNALKKEGDYYAVITFDKVYTKL
jgi:cation diffusion facilitator family transporter